MTWLQIAGLTKVNVPSQIQDGVLNTGNTFLFYGWNMVQKY